jgi:uncharacterized protein YbjQ (UPF0145 family)
LREKAQRQLITNPFTPTTATTPSPARRTCDTIAHLANGGGKAMLVTTTEAVAGHIVKASLGQVFGVVVRSRGIGGNITAGLRSIIGGEIPEYTRLIEETRLHAIDRMVANATLMGANAVVMMRFDSGEIAQSMNEVVAYGTAVILDPAPGV